MKKLILLLALVANSHSIVFSQECLPQGISFTTQEEIDNFQSDYPGCVVIGGNVYIGTTWPNTTDIINLNGLSEIIAIGGCLSIQDNLLSDLSGLNNLTSIGGYLYIGYNETLADMSGLENLTSIGEDFFIDYNYSLTSLPGLNNLTTIGGNLAIYQNNALTNITVLYNLTSIGEYLLVGFNNTLTSLSGLENIQTNSIEFLHIYQNHSLSDCAIQSICNYLASPNCEVEIFSNDPGCNSQAEVESACLTPVEEKISNEEISLFPNPASAFITFVAPQNHEIEEIIFYNQLGQVVLSVREATNPINISNLSPGIYFAAVRTSDRKLMAKVFIE